MMTQLLGSDDGDVVPAKAVMRLSHLTILAGLAWGSSSGVWCAKAFTQMVMCASGILSWNDSRYPGDDRGRICVLRVAVHKNRSYGGKGALAAARDNSLVKFLCRHTKHLCLIHDDMSVSDCGWFPATFH